MTYTFKPEPTMTETTGVFRRLPAPATTPAKPKPKPKPKKTKKKVMAVKKKASRQNVRY